MNKNKDVVALGELLIDFTDNGVSEQGNTIYEANPGGAPCNVLSMLSRFGHKTAFLGKVGDDIFGVKLKKTLDDLNIDTSNLLIDKEARTTLAFVENMENGDRDFSFYRNPGADMMLKEEEIDANILDSTSIFHFGTLSMTHEGNRKATKKAIRVSKKSGALISFDPNLRPPLWKSLDDAKEQALYGLTQCDILKISDNEIQWLTNENDFTIGVNKIREEYNIPLILLTMGKDGSRAYYKDLCIEIASFLQDNTIDTTGAGDTFVGCILHFILKYDFDELTEGNLKEMLIYANAAASIITTKKGALKVMPEIEEIENLITKSYVMLNN